MFPPSAGRAIHLSFGGYQAPASIHNQAAAFFGERLRARLGEDRVRMTLIGDVLALGRPSGDLPLMVESGELDFCYLATVRFTPWVPDLRIFELPYVVRDRAAAQRALAGALGGRFAADMARTSPFRLLGLWDNGIRHVTNRMRPIHGPDDCRGLRIRIQKSELIAESLAALGFVPVPVDIKEFLEQIATDRFDAQENPLTNVYNFRVHEHHPHVTLSGHCYGVAAVVCSARRYASWPAEVRAAVDEAAHEAMQHQHRLAAAEDEAMLARLAAAGSAIVHLDPAERARFVDAAGAVLARHRAQYDPALFAALG